MKKLLLALLLVTSSCYSIDGFDCSTPSAYTQSQAQSYYESFSATRYYADEERAKELFGCNYHKTTDYIYSYSTFWGKKIILVRHNKAITYVDEN